MDNRLHVLFQYLKENKIVKHIPIFIYQNSYIPLNNDELLSDLGINYHYTQKNNNLNEKVILINGKKWKYVSYKEKEKDDKLLIIDSVDVDLLKDYKKNNNFIKILINYLITFKSQFFCELILSGIGYLSIFYIVLYIFNMIELSFNLKDRSFLKYSFLIIFMLMLLLLICKYIKKLNLNKYTKRLKVANKCDRGDYKIGKNIFNNISSLISTLVPIALMYFIDQKSLFYTEILIISIILLTTINLFYFKDDNSCLIKIRKLFIYLFCLSIVYSTFIFLSYRVMADSIDTELFFIELILIIEIILPFAELLINIRNYVQFLFYHNENRIIDKNIINEQELLIHTPNVVVDNVTDIHGIFNNLNMNIKRNSIIEICGEAGSGKTFIYEMFVKQTLIKDGNIFFLNDQEIILEEKYNNIIAYSSSYNFFENKTLREFLTLGINQMICDEYIDEMVKMLNITTIIDKMNFKYDTILKASDFSNNEIALLNILRLFIKDSRINFLDHLLSQLSEIQLLPIIEYMKTNNATYIILENTTVENSNIDTYYLIENKNIKEIVY